MPFKIKYTEYSAAGALTNVVHYEYFPTPDLTENRFTELDNEKQDNGMRKYKVELLVETYMQIDNPKEFLAQFHAD